MSLRPRSLSSRLVLLLWLELKQILQHGIVVLVIRLVKFYSLWLGSQFYLVNLLNSIKHACIACSCNKMHKLPFYVSSLQSKKPFDLIYSDVQGPFKIISKEVYKYYIFFVDHFTRYIWLIPIFQKSDAYDIILKFKLIAKKRHRSIRETGLTLLHQASMP